MAVGSHRAKLGKPPQGAQPVRVASGEHEAGHDRVGITEVRMTVMMLEYLGKGRQSPDKVDHEHPRHGVAAELIHRDDAWGRTGGR